MANLFDYITWRGDLSFRQDGINAVDAMLFSNLAYIRLGGSAQSNPDKPMALREAAEEFFLLPDCGERCRYESDLQQFHAAADSSRFGSLKIVEYLEDYDEIEEIQFAAATFLLDDGGIVISFRGTDRTLVGWKEDFNMTYQKNVPAQRNAVLYVRRLARKYPGPIYLCGHSKGGNLAVYAAAKCGQEYEARIACVYNMDGPGFTEYMLHDADYQAIVPKIHTFIPQSSMVGLMMERLEPVTIVHSSQIGILQHDPITWSVKGKEPVQVSELTADSVFMQKTLRFWLSSMDEAERESFVNTLYSALTSGNATKATELLHPKNLRSFAHYINTDEEAKETLAKHFQGLRNAVLKAAGFDEDEKRDKEEA